MSCAGNGYLSGNMLTAYPFEDGQCLAWECGETMSNEAQVAIQKCFVDAGVYIDSQYVDSEGWPSIGMFRINGSSLSFRLHAHNGYVDISVSDQKQQFPIVSGRSEWGTYVVVMSSEGIRDLMSFCRSNGISPPDPGSSSPSVRDGGFWLRVCAKCICAKPHGLSSIMVYDGAGFDTSEHGYRPGDRCAHKGTLCICRNQVPVKGRWKSDDWFSVPIDRIFLEEPDSIIHGDVSMKPGHNMSLTEPDSGVSGMSIEAIPGAGLGKLQCRCDDDLGIMARISSPDGHVRFFNDTCYDLEPAISDGRYRGELRIHVKCTACCTCEMFESIVNDRLVPLFAMIKKAKSDIGEDLSLYEQGVKSFNRRISVPSMSDIRMSLSGMPIGEKISPRLSGTDIKGRMERCAFTATIRNSSYSEVRISIHSMSATDEIVETSASYSDASGDPKSKTSDSPSGLTGSEFAIYPGRSLVVTFISARQRMVGSVGGSGYSAKISAGISYIDRNGAKVGMGTVSKSVEV